MTSSLQLEPPAGRSIGTRAPANFQGGGQFWTPSRNRDRRFRLGWTAAPANGCAKASRREKRRLLQEFRLPAIAAPVRQTSFALSSTRSTRHAFVFESLRAAWISTRSPVLHSFASSCAWYLFDLMTTLS